LKKFAVPKIDYRQPSNKMVTMDTISTSVQFLKIMLDMIGMIE